MLEDLKKAIKEGDVSRVEELFQDDDDRRTRLAASVALCYAARAGSVPMLKTLIQVQKGVGRPVMNVF